MKWLYLMENFNRIRRMRQPCTTANGADGALTQLLKLMSCKNITEEQSRCSKGSLS